MSSVVRWVANVLVQSGLWHRKWLLPNQNLPLENRTTKKLYRGMIWELLCLRHSLILGKGFCFCPGWLFCTCKYFLRGDSGHDNNTQHLAMGLLARVLSTSDSKVTQPFTSHPYHPSLTSSTPLWCAVSLYIHTSFSNLHTCLRSQDFFLQSCWLWWPWPYYQGRMGVGGEKRKKKKERNNEYCCLHCMLFVSIRWVSPCLLFKDFVSLPLKNSSACM